MITYAQESYDKVYSAKIVSISTCICLFVYLLILVIPFVLVYASNNFWITVLKVMEQPNITILDDYFISVLRNDQTQIFTNIQTFAKSDYMSQLPDAKIQSSSYDRNSDGLNDEISLDISFGNSSLGVQQIFIMILADVEFSLLNYKAKSVLIFDATSNVGVSSLQIYGTAQFYQSQPLTYNNFPRYDYNYDMFKAEDYDIQKIFQQYYTRDYNLQPVYSQQLIAGNGQTSTNIQIRLMVDQKSPIQIKPTFLGQIKLAWVQYCAVLIPIILFGQSLLRFIYSYRFTHTHKDTNLPLNFKEF